MNIQDWFPLGRTGLISLLFKWLSRVFFWTPQFKSINSSVLSFLYGPTLTSIEDSWIRSPSSRWSTFGTVTPADNRGGGGHAGGSRPVTGLSLALLCCSSALEPWHVGSVAPTCFSLGLKGQFPAVQRQMTPGCRAWGSILYPYWPVLWIHLAPWWKPHRGPVNHTDGVPAKPALSVFILHQFGKRAQPVGPPAHPALVGRDFRSPQNKENEPADGDSSRNFWAFLLFLRRNISTWTHLPGFVDWVRWTLSLLPPELKERLFLLQIKWLEKF